jgi:hypothetical protein
MRVRKSVIITFPSLGDVEVKASDGEVAVFDLPLHIHGFAHDRPVCLSQRNRGASHIPSARIEKNDGN